MIQVQISRRSPEAMMLRAGQAMDGVEVLKIEAANGSVQVMVDGKARTLALEAKGDQSNIIDGDSSPVIRLPSIPLELAISLYADYKNRTVMQHPQLGKLTFSLDANPHSKEEAAAMCEKMFREQNIATIPDGEHFVMLVPFALTNIMNPRADTIDQTNTVVPKLSVNFRSAPIALVLSAYGDYVHKEIVNLHDNTLPLGETVTFAQTTPLSRAELCYALETQIEWHHIRIVPAGDKWKAERIPLSK